MPSVDCEKILSANQDSLYFPHTVVSGPDTSATKRDRGLELYRNCIMAPLQSSDDFGFHDKLLPAAHTFLGDKTTTYGLRVGVLSAVQLKKK